MTPEAGDPTPGEIAALRPRPLLGRTTGRVLAGAAIVLGLVVAYGVGIEPGLLRVKLTRIPLRGWTGPSIRVAVLCDLHVGAPHVGLEKVRVVVDRTNAQRPDLALIAGDLVIHDVVGGRFVEPEPIARELARLRARRGVFAVLGNHDWWYDGARVRRALEGASVRVLEDAAVRLDLANGSLWLAGVGDYWETPHDVGAALSGVPAAAPVILFTHNPDVFPDVPRRVSLSIAGHTHGGQVDLPFLGPLIVPSRFGARYARGYIVEGGRHLYVSPGIGTSILPIRIGVVPEVSVLDLVRDAS